MHDLRGDGIFGIDQAIAQAHHLATRRACVLGPPDLAAAQRYFDRLVDEAVGRSRAIFKRCAIHKRLEGRARLAPRLLHMVKRIFGKVAAADPGFDVAIAWVERQKSSLQARFFLAQCQHEGAVGKQRLQRLFIALTAVPRHLVLARFAHKSAHQVFSGSPDTRPPLDIGRALQGVAVAHHRLRRQVLQARVDGGVDYQTVGIDVVVVAVRPVNQPAA